MKTLILNLQLAVVSGQAVTATDKAQCWNSEHVTSLDCFLPAAGNLILVMCKCCYETKVSS